MQEKLAQLERIDAILSAGASSVTVNGVTTVFDFAELRRQRQRLREDLGLTRRRRRILRPVRQGRR